MNDETEVRVAVVLSPTYRQDRLLGSGLLAASVEFRCRTGSPRERARAQAELAWEYAIRAAQTGVATDFEFDALAGSAPSPVDIRERLDAPRGAVLTDPAGETVYEKDIRFDDLDAHGENAEELARHVGEILERTSARGR